MPRPQKIALDYWPFDVGLQRDRKLRKPKHKYGYLATEVYIALLSILYGDKGYYIDYSDPVDVGYTVLDHLQGKHQPSVETVVEIIEFLVACELFSGDHFKDKIITSHRAQCTYYSATADRLQVTVNENIWMLTPEEMRVLSTRHSLYKNWVNRSINDVDQSSNPQSKVKESKEDIEEEEGGGQAPDNMDVYEFYEYIFGEELTNGRHHSLKMLLELYGEDEVFEAIETVKGRSIKQPVMYLQKYLAKEAG